MNSPPRWKRLSVCARSGAAVSAVVACSEATSTARQPLSSWNDGCRAKDGMMEQRRSDGSLRHLITLEGIRRDEVEAILERAARHARRTGERPPTAATLRGVTIANLFTEPSTRTRVSFELAGRRLGADVVNLEVQLSSRVKGETMLDTIYTLQALHFDVFVIRDAQPGVLS